MPWVVGIDEAGYGPNLGPFLQAAVALRLPEDDVAGWETLKPWVRRAHEKDDGRLLIDDSKKVYAGAKGFEKLERGVLGALRLKWIMFGEFVSFLGLPGTKPDIDAEPWFDGTSYLETQTVLDASIAFVGRSHVFPPTRFNRILDVHHSKAVVLSQGLTELMRGAIGTDSNEAMHFICDKQGGRNFYAPLLQEAFPDGWVVAERESAAESRYRVLNLNRDVTVVFRPKADGDSVCVALASMICKYLREVCMGQFNAFWQKHVPGLLPTAGYPVDAKRFYAEIRPAMQKLGIHPDAVWRKK